MEYYSKEMYEKYGDILESKEDIEARLKKHDIINKKNKELTEQYRKEWEERTFMNKIYKRYFSGGAMSRVANHNNLDNVNFIDDD
jgi:hypothetical protein